MLDLTYLVNYQHEADQGKLTTITMMNKLLRKVDVSSMSHLPEQNIKTSAFLNSPWRLIYPYQLHIDN